MVLKIHFQFSGISQAAPHQQCRRARFCRLSHKANYKNSVQDERAVIITDDVQRVPGMLHRQAIFGKWPKGEFSKMRKVVPRSPACQVVSEPFEPVAFDVNGYQGAFPDKSFCKLRRRRKCENEQSVVTLPCLPVSFQHITCAQVGNKYELTSALIGQKSDLKLPPNSGEDVSVFYSQLGNNFARIL